MTKRDAAPPDPADKEQARIGPNTGPSIVLDAGPNQAIDSPLYTELPAESSLPPVRPRRPAESGFVPILLIDALALLLVVATGPAAWLWLDSSHPTTVAPVSTSAVSPSGDISLQSSPPPTAEPVPSIVPGKSAKLVYGTGTWTKVDSLPVPIWGSAGALLKDGRVLVAGGAAGASSAQASGLVWIFNPASGHWATATSMLQPRAYPMIAALADGSVLVAGGSRNGQPLDTAERYNPANGTWVAAGRMNIPRSQGSLVVLADGRVLATGGGMEGTPGWSSTASVEIYDPKTGKWTMGPPMMVARARHTATLLSNGEVLVTGGATTYHGEIGSVTATAEIYNSHSNKWRQAAFMSIPRYVHQAALLANGRVLVAGGWSFTANSDPSKSSAEIYDPVTDKWAPTGSLAAPRAEFVMVRLGDDRVLAVDGIDHDYRLLASSEIYDPVAGTWKASGALPTALMWPAAVVLADGRVLIAGGATNIAGSGRTATCELYAPTPR
jgi:hypothetical protein